MADMVADGQDNPTHTVAQSTRSCLASFQECLDKAAGLHHRELSMIEDQLARFSLWAASMRVFGASRESLDHRLRAASEVSDIVISLVQALEYRVQSCSQLLGSADPAIYDGGPEPIRSGFQEAIEGIGGEISLLHKITNTVRRASKEKQDLQAAQMFRIQDDDGNDVEPYLASIFTNMLRDRFPGINTNICQRLVNTMLLRRKRILHRRSRYEKAPIRPRHVPAQPVLSHPKPRLKIKEIKEIQETSSEQPRMKPSSSTVAPSMSVAQTATTLNPEDFRKASAPSVVSDSKTIALSSYDELGFPPAPCGRVLGIYEKLKADREEKFRILFSSAADRRTLQDVESQHKAALKEDWKHCVRSVGDVQCPFCFHALPASDAVNERTWRSHVKRDLDPYVCLFEECDSADKLYSHSEPWLKHMKSHALKWHCSSKSHKEFVCSSRDEYMTHLKMVHSTKLSDARLDILADRNARLIGPLFDSCPLCGIEQIDQNMDEHVAGHLVFLAVKSLPSYEDGVGEVDSAPGGSLGSSCRHSRSTVGNDSERGVRPQFNNVGPIPENQLPPRGSPSKYAEWGGLRNYLLFFPQGAIGLDFIDFKAPPIFQPEDPRSSYDSSGEFVDRDMFGDAVIHQLRSHEWGLIVKGYEENLQVKEDSILESFRQRASRARPSTLFNMPSCILGKPQNKRSIIRFYPDCTICRAPGNLACDCEAKALDFAVRRAEQRMMESVYSDIRGWVRAHSQDYALEYFRLRADAQRARRQMPTVSAGLMVDDTSQRLQRKLEIDEAWKETYQGYPQVMEYFYSLVELTLPSDHEAAVRDPPLSAITGRQKAAPRLHPIPSREKSTYTQPQAHPLESRKQRFGGPPSQILRPVAPGPNEYIKPPLPTSSYRPPGHKSNPRDPKRRVSDGDLGRSSPKLKYE